MMEHIQSGCSLQAGSSALLTLCATNSWPASADFDTMSKADEYETLMRTAIRGVPEHWIPDIAKQCLHAPVQQTGRR